MRMDSLQRERGDSPFMICGGTEQLHAGDFLQALQRIRGDFVFMRGDVIHAKRGEIIHCRAKTDRFSNGGRACFKFMR